MAVPVVPPPPGEKFAGGYQIQRNPITGGARLLPPAAPGDNHELRINQNLGFLLIDIISYYHM